MGYVERSILNVVGFYYFFISMSQRQYLLITMAIFTLVGIVHALRLLYHWAFIIGLTFMPMWVSWVGLAVCIFLVASASRLLKK